MVNWARVISGFVGIGAIGACIYGSNNYENCLDRYKSLGIYPEYSSLEKDEKILREKADSYAKFDKEIKYKFGGESYIDQTRVDKLNSEQRELKGKMEKILENNPEIGSLKSKSRFWEKFTTCSVYGVLGAFTFCGTCEKPRHKKKESKKKEDELGSMPVTG